MHKYPFDSYDGAVDHVTACIELQNFKADGAAAPTWFNQVHIWNVLEIALSKNKYEAVFDYYLQRYGYQKKSTEPLELDEQSSDDKDEEILTPIDFDDIEEINHDEFLNLDELLRSGELDQVQYRQYYKYRFQYEYPNISHEFFPMMLNTRGRHILKRVNWEVSKKDSKILLRDQLANDYLETVSYDSIILDKINHINMCLGVEYSADPREIPLSAFSNPKVLSCLLDMSMLLSMKKSKKDVTNVESLYKFWNGCSIAPIRAKGGKGILQRRINGKVEKMYQIVGLEGFRKGM